MQGSETYVFKRSFWVWMEYRLYRSKNGERCASLKQLQYCRREMMEVCIMTVVESMMKNIWIPIMKVTGFTDKLDMGYIKGIKFNFQVTGLSNW